MKQIPLRVAADPQLGDITWGDVIRQVVRRPLNPQQGVDIEEMRRGIRILDALDASADVLELEDADWEHLVTKTKAMQWAVVDRRLLQFYDDVMLAGLTAAHNGLLSH